MRAEADYPTDEAILRSYRELAGLFTAEVTSFERKRYANLSHAPNKAMNLNSYIALMGRRLVEKPTRRGLVLRAAPGTAAGFDVPDTDYVLTLDADSLLEPRYMVRLVHSWSARRTRGSPSPRLHTAPSRTRHAASSGLRVRPRISSM